MDCMPDSSIKDGYIMKELVNFALVVIAVGAIAAEVIIEEGRRGKRKHTGGGLIVSLVAAVVLVCALIGLGALNLN